MRHPVVRMVILALLVIAVVLAALLGYTGEDEYGLPGRVPGKPAVTTTTRTSTGSAGWELGRRGPPPPRPAGGALA